MKEPEEQQVELESEGQMRVEPWLLSLVMSRSQSVVESRT